MATVNVTSGQGAAYTWTSPSITWDAPASGKTWDNLYNTAYSATITEDTATVAELPKKTPNKLSKETCAVAELPKKNTGKKALEAWTTAGVYSDLIAFIRTFAEMWATAELSKYNPQKLAKETAAFAELKRSTTGKVAKETLGFSEVYSEVAVFIRNIAENVAMAEAYSDAASFSRILDEAFSIADLTKKTITALKKRGLILNYAYGQNVWSGPLYVYNNLGIPNTLTTLSGETFRGQSIYRLTMTPNTDAQVNSLRNNLWNHGVRGSYMIYYEGTPHCATIFWRPVNKTDVVVGGNASNIPGWGTTVTVPVEDGWYMSYVPWNYSQSKYDSKYWSFKCPSININESVSIDFAYPIIQRGVSTPLFDTVVDQDFNITKAIAESFLTTEQYSDVVSFVRLLTQSIVINELYNDVATWNKKFLDVLTTSELVKKQSTSTQKQQFALTDQIGSEYTWADSVFDWNSDVSGRSWNNQRKISPWFVVQSLKKETINTTELQVKNTAKLIAETTNIADANIRALAFIRAFAESLLLVDFTARVINKKTLNTLSVSDTWTDLINYIRTLTEAVSFNELAKRSISQFKNDPVNIADLGKRQPGKRNNETITTVELAKRDAGKKALETVGVGELSSKTINALKKESIAISEAYTDLVGFIRLFTEALITAEFNQKLIGITKTDALGLTENRYLIAASMIKEALQVVQGNYYRWDTSSYTWTDTPASHTWDTVCNDGTVALNVIKKVIEPLLITRLLRKIVTCNLPLESIAMTDKMRNDLALVKKEITAVIDKIIKTTAVLRQEILTLTEKPINDNFKPIFETVSFAELYIDYINFFLRVAETVALAEVIANQVNVIKQNSVGIIDARQTAIAKKSLKVVSIGEFTNRQSAKKINETAAVAELDNRQPGKRANDVVSVSEFAKRDSSKKTLETVGVSEAYWDYIIFILRALENIIISEKQLKTLSVPKQDAFSVAEKSSRTHNKITLQSMTVADSFSRRADFKLALQELIRITELLAKRFNISQKEVVRLVSEVIRNANAVLSDIVFATGDMSLEEFLVLEAPAGFEKFREFIAGDLEYQKALVKIILEAGVTTSRPLITEWKMNVDLPDIPDRGTITIPAATALVSFNRKFINIPEVTITLKGGTVIAIPKLVSVTNTGFYVELRDTNNNLVAGTISWTAIGC